LLLLAAEPVAMAVLVEAVDPEARSQHRALVQPLQKQLTLLQLEQQLRLAPITMEKTVMILSYLLVHLWQLLEMVAVLEQEVTEAVTPVDLEEETLIQDVQSPKVAAVPHQLEELAHKVATVEYLPFNKIG
jgi:hypothetical protein